MTDATETIDKLSLLAATSILKYEKDESEVVHIGCQYCDRLDELEDTLYNEESEYYVENLKENDVVKRQKKSQD